MSGVGVKAAALSSDPKMQEQNSAVISALWDVVRARAWPEEVTELQLLLLLLLLLLLMLLAAVLVLLPPLLPLLPPLPLPLPPPLTLSHRTTSARRWFTSHR